MKKMSGENPDLHLVRSCTQCALDVNPAQAVYSALVHLSVGCWCFSAHKPITTSVTAHTGVSHFPPLVCLPTLSLLFYSVSVPFPPPPHPPPTPVFVYSFLLHFSMDPKVQVLSPQHAKYCLRCPTAELRASTEKHRSIHYV